MSYDRAVTSLLLALLAALPAAAQTVGGINLEREEWRVIGWNDACSVAFVHLSYPRLGEAIHAEPVSSRVGFFSIPPGEEKASLRWTLTAEGPLSWNARAFAKAEKALQKIGYTRPGFLEPILDVPTGLQPGLSETLRSTSTLASRVRDGWPGPEWRWAAASYNPLATCALLVFEKPDQKFFYRFQMVRVYDPRARIERARAHTTNSRLLFDAGDQDSAAAEAKTGALLAPELAVTRYHYAAMSALMGQANKALAELAEAVRIDPKYKTRARENRDFEDIAQRDDFKALTR